MRGFSRGLAQKCLTSLHLKSSLATIQYSRGSLLVNPRERQTSEPFLLLENLHKRLVTAKTLSLYSSVKFDLPEGWQK